MIDIITVVKNANISSHHPSLADYHPMLIVHHVVGLYR
jgi:hypothetical protein